ncbi:MAG: PAS domain-containing sensor histidine kinase [Bradyrhizobiaceae bacterium PARB1]|jgi:two-component system, cell cycle sensor histidine kinase PleC|nr:MAG: PAS domain-containing sensor histidine kinase [Bradyrhizobiaceae bacterium PARB1]
MSRAHADNACVQSDSIKGLAQSIAKPAYHRLLIAEPALRRAVPTLIIAFLITIFFGAFVQVVDQSRQKQASLKRDLAALGDLVAERLDRNGAVRHDRPAAIERLQALLPSLIPAWGIAPGRHVIVLGADQSIIARMPTDVPADDDKRILDTLSAAQNMSAQSQRTDVFDIALPDGNHALATRRIVRALPGQIVVLQENNDSVWRSESALSITLSATTGFVVLILGFAFHWQSTRAREGDAINDAVRGRIDTALNRGRCGLWDWDLSRGRIFWSQSMFTMLGLDSRSDLLTFGEVNALVRPEDINLFEIADQLVSQQIDYIDRTFRMQHSDGHWIWLQLRCELVAGQSDGSQHLIGIAIDVTEQKSLAQKSVEADVRLRDAIETIPEAFVLWDADDRLVLCNSHFQRLHKLPDSAVRPGTPYETVLEVGSMPEVRSRLADAASAAQGARTFEAQLQNGTWLHISERRTKDGGYVSVGTNITRIKEHEQKLVDNDLRLRASVIDLKHSQAALEKQALELADLAQKYSDEKTRAEEANATKSKFLANMSHELRTPLNAIIGFSEIMGSGMFGHLGSEKYSEYCHDILTSGHYLLEVINDILDMSKIEAGRMKLDLEPLDLGQILSESLRVVSGRAEAKNLALGADIAADVAVVADRRAIKQIFVNLLSNAVKFTPDGGRVTVRSRVMKNSVALIIADSGIGIAPHALKRLGRPFEQVESQLTKTYHGSGLGLAIAKSLTGLHGGAMKLRSKPDVGTVVCISLPLEGKRPAVQVSRAA